MQQMHWLETHLESLAETINIVNQCGWELTIDTGQITVGDDPKRAVFRSGTRDLLDAFSYGMGLAYVGLPQHLFDQLAAKMRTIPVNQRQVDLKPTADNLVLINRLRWDLRLIESGQQWWVTTGAAEKHPLFSADSRPAVDAFLAGMGLAYTGIPQAVFSTLVDDMNAWFDSL